MILLFYNSISLPLDKMDSSPIGSNIKIPVYLPSVIQVCVRVIFAPGSKNPGSGRPGPHASSLQTHIFFSPPGAEKEEKDDVI